MTRSMAFDGIQNFRDFGGYATVCGRGLKAGLLFRSANHHRATDADLQRLRDLGVAVIVDLRQRYERDREPSRRWPGFVGEVVENDAPELNPDFETEARAAPELSPAWFHEHSRGFYARAPFEARYQDLFRRYFRALAQSQGAVLVHCAAGKDRTGMICALTHHIAGVHRDDMLTDFLLTNDEAQMARKMRFVGPWLEKTLGRRPSDEALRVAVRVEPEYLESAFLAMSAAHGSVDGYLRDVLGVDDAMRERIHARLLGEPAPA